MYILYQGHKVYLESLDELQKVGKETSSKLTKAKKAFRPSGFKTFKREDFEQIWKFIQDHKQFKAVKDLLPELLEMFPTRNPATMARTAAEMKGFVRPATHKMSNFLKSKKEPIPDSVDKAGKFE